MIHVGDCLQVMASLPADSAHAIVTDPPYHLTSASRGGHARTNNPDSPHGRHRIGDKGFMGKVWDGGDIALRAETWAAALRVAKPGAYLAAFGSTRTFHRLMVAIEDAGWELRDTLMWVYGSGFPKSKNQCTCRPPVPTPAIDAHGWRLCGACGKQFELGTALKPAWEPIVLARKPLIGNVALNVLVHGTGAMNIDGARVLGEPMRPNTGAGGLPRRAVDEERGAGEVSQPHDLGRWPANVVHDGSEQVLAAFPNAPGQQRDTGPEFERNAQVYGKFAGVSAHAARGDSGSAARFFYCAKASKDDRDSGLEAFELREAGIKNDSGRGFSESDPHRKIMRGNHHPTVKPTDLMRWLCRLVTPRGGVVLDPFAGSGSTGRGAIAEGFQFVGIELDPEYAAIAEARTRVVQPGLALGSP